ncbi:hypothetical protein TNCV_1907091 [Trichonephila clavipes]|nr:hypothetical protein TNCV_1907091 [Trichonephila clavipes]
MGIEIETERNIEIERERRGRCHAKKKTATREPETFGASCGMPRDVLEQLTSSLPIILEKRERGLGSVPNGVVFCGIRQRLKSTVNIKNTTKTLSVLCAPLLWIREENDFDEKRS